MTKLKNTKIFETIQDYWNFIDNNNNYDDVYSIYIKDTKLYTSNYNLLTKLSHYKISFKSDIEKDYSRFAKGHLKLNEQIKNRYLAIPTINNDHEDINRITDISDTLKTITNFHYINNIGNNAKSNSKALNMYGETILEYIKIRNKEDDYLKPNTIGNSTIEGSGDNGKLEIHTKLCKEINNGFINYKNKTNETIIDCRGDAVMNIVPIISFLLKDINNITISLPYYEYYSLQNDNCIGTMISSDIKNNGSYNEPTVKDLSLTIDNKNINGVSNIFIGSISTGKRQILRNLNVVSDKNYQSIVLIYLSTGGYYFYNNMNKEYYYEEFSIKNINIQNTLTSIRFLNSIGLYDKLANKIYSRKYIPVNVNINEGELDLEYLGFELSNNSLIYDSNNNREISYYSHCYMYLDFKSINVIIENSENYILLPPNICNLDIDDFKNNYSIITSPLTRNKSILKEIVDITNNPFIGCNYTFNHILLRENTDNLIIDKTYLFTKFNIYIDDSPYYYYLHIGEINNINNGIIIPCSYNIDNSSGENINYKFAIGVFGNFNIKIKTMVPFLTTECLINYVDDKNALYYEIDRDCRFNNLEYTVLNKKFYGWGLGASLTNINNLTNVNFNKVKLIGDIHIKYDDIITKNFYDINNLCLAGDEYDFSECNIELDQYVSFAIKIKDTDVDRILTRDELLSNKVSTAANFNFPIIYKSSIPKNENEPFEYCERTKVYVGDYGIDQIYNNQLIRNQRIIFNNIRLYTNKDRPLVLSKLYDFGTYDNHTFEIILNNNIRNNSKYGGQFNIPVTHMIIPNCKRVIIDSNVIIGFNDNFMISSIIFNNKQSYDLNITNYTNIIQSDNENLDIIFENSKILINDVVMDIRYNFSTLYKSTIEIYNNPFSVIRTINFINYTYEILEESIEKITNFFNSNISLVYNNKENVRFVFWRNVYNELSSNIKTRISLFGLLQFKD